MVALRSSSSQPPHLSTTKHIPPTHHCLHSYEKGTPCFRQLVKHFGDRIVGDDGAIDRRALGGIVFADPAKRKELEGIVWPEIRRLMEQDIQALGEVRSGVWFGSVDREGGRESWGEGRRGGSVCEWNA